MKTCLYDIHVQAGAKIVDFAGYLMPLHYEMGILKEHLHTRAQVGLFDVSHMGQILVKNGSEALAKLLPVALDKLGVHQSKYSFLMNEDGGIEDDLILTKLSEEGDYLIVVNASRKEHDYQILSEYASCVEVKDRALLALQGPEAVSVLSRLIPGVQDLKFMHYVEFSGFWVTRSGYTGEDGFEISVPQSEAISFANKLVADDRVKWIGLGARDSLRLEAGLSLYGHELDTGISPIEADLGWAVTKVRTDYLGAHRVVAEREQSPKMIRVGIQPLGRLPAREETPIFNMQEELIGKITSGGFSPSLQKPIAMGFVNFAYREIGTKVKLKIREQFHEAEIVTLPFVPHRYFKGAK